MIHLDLLQGQVRDLSIEGDGENLNSMFSRMPHALGTRSALWQTFGLTEATTVLSPFQMWA